MWLIVAIVGLFVYLCGCMIEEDKAGNSDGSGFKVVGWVMMFFGGIAFYIN